MYHRDCWVCFVTDLMRVYNEMMLACTRDIGCSATPSCSWAELVLSRLGKWGTLDRSFSVSQTALNNAMISLTTILYRNTMSCSCQPVTQCSGQKTNVEAIVVFVASTDSHWSVLYSKRSVSHAAWYTSTSIANLPLDVIEWRCSKVVNAID